MVNKTKKKTLLAMGVSAGLTLALAACSSGGDPLSSDAPAEESSGGSIIVGSADFAESQLLAKIYELALDDIGIDASEKPNIGSREVYITAITDGSIDLIPEYNGYLLEKLDPEAEFTDRDQIQESLFENLPENVTVLDYASAENTNVLVVTKEFSDEHGGLETISDLAEIDDGTFKLAGPPEWRSRPNTGIPAIRDIYGMDFENRFEILDGGGPLSLAAVVNGQVEISMLFSSDPAISENNLVALTDDKVLFPPANILPMIRTDKVDDAIEAQLNKVSEKLVIEDLMEMNGRVNAGDDLTEIAKDWLTETGII